MNFSSKKWGEVGDTSPVEKGGGRHPAASPPHYTPGSRTSGGRKMTELTDAVPSGKWSLKQRSWI